MGFFPFKIKINISLLLYIVTILAYISVVNPLYLWNFLKNKLQLENTPVTEPNLIRAYSTLKAYIS